MATKLNILALLTRTLQQKEVYKFSYKHVCNCQCRMPTSRAMRKRKEQQEQQKKKDSAFHSPKHILRFVPWLRDTFYDACRTGVLLCAEGKPYSATTP